MEHCPENNPCTSYLYTNRQVGEHSQKSVSVRRSNAFGADTDQNDIGYFKWPYCRHDCSTLSDELKNSLGVGAGFILKTPSHRHRAVKDETIQYRRPSSIICLMESLPKRRPLETRASSSMTLVTFCVCPPSRGRTT